MIKTFEHVGLVVKDAEKQKSFYCNTLGLRFLQEKESVAPPTGDHTNIPGARRKLVFLGDANGKELLELVYYIDPPSPAGSANHPNQVNAIHLCFGASGLQEKYKELLGKGLRFLTPPKVIDMPGGSRVCLCYLQDPEGNWLELKEVLGKS